MVGNKDQQYQVHYSAKKIGDFVKIKNKVAHGNYSFESEDYELWPGMTVQLEKIMLRISIKVSTMIGQ